MDKMPSVWKTTFPLLAHII